MAACKYDDQNLNLGKLLLENSIEPSIRKSMHHHNSPTDESVSYYNVLCNHVLGQANTKLKLYQQTILDTKLTDFVGFNVTNYHEKIIPALCSAHQGNSLPTAFGGKLLANHAGLADPGFNSLVSLYTAKMHTLNMTESQYNKTLDQLPQLEKVFWNCEEWEATHKNKDESYVARGL